MRLPAVSLLALLALPALALASPLQTRNEAALSRFALLPVLGETRLAPRERAAISLQLDLTSEFYLDQTARESLRLDGETLNLQLHVHQGFGPHWELGLRLSLLDTGGGFMDSFIENWHDWFGLPNGNREQAPQDEYRYRIVRDGEVLLDRREGASGLGDTQVLAGYRRVDGRVWRAALKLPTGDADRLSGGSWGAAAWVDQILPFAAEGRWSGQLSLGGAVQETAGALADLQRPAQAFGQLAVQARVWGPLSALGQLYAHSPLYETLENEAADPGLQLALGGRWRFNPRWALDLAFQEDLIVNASPDFSLLLGLRYRPISPGS
jgi:hypothetical protein